MTVTLPGIESLQLSLTMESRVHASIETTFTALLDQLGPFNETPDGTPMPMKIEPWPGGRWLRDLGDDNGHFWGHVQAIKRPTLIEISGPLFMSYPVANNVQYRLSEEGAVTVVRFNHRAFGLIEDAHRTGVVTGWTYILDQATKRAEQGQAKSAIH
jgi:uncharacterized protein YndB with AHSA1/START domain